MENKHPAPGATGSGAGIDQHLLLDSPPIPEPQAEPRPRGQRRRLPNRRPAVTHEIVVDGSRFVASIGFDELARPRELFLTGGKPGSQVDAILGDAAVAVSVAL